MERNKGSRLPQVPKTSSGVSKPKPLAQMTVTAELNMKLLLTLALAAVLLGCSSAAKYTYLQDGPRQLRVDEKAGRTDMWTDKGWVPMSFDQPPQDLTKLLISEDVQTNQVSVSNARWDSDTNQICSDKITNNSDYVLQHVRVQIEANPDGKPLPDLDVVSLQKATGFFLPHEELASGCGKTEIPHPANNKWTYRVSGIKGWHQ
jgi:hypothetical protein